VAELQDKSDTPFFDWLLENWPDQDAAGIIRNRAHAREVGRAAQPPVVNVALAGVPGHFTGTAGQGEVAYVPPSPHPLA
jgi:hypothetical protein